MANKKGVKMSLGDFMGDSQGTSNLPTGPKERHDDGSFRPNHQHRPHRGDDGPSRSEQDSSWRRGGGGGGGGGGGFDNSTTSRGGYDRGGYGNRGGRDDRPGGNYNRNEGGDDDRVGGSWRGGGGGSNNRNEGGDEDRVGGSWRGGGGGRHRDNNEDRGSWRGGGGGGGGGGYRDRSGASGEGSEPAPAGERPRLNLKSRTSQTGGTSPAASTRKDPFGGASAVDTASKLVDLKIKQPHSEEKPDVEAEDEDQAKPAEELQSPQVPGDEAGEKPKVAERRRREPEVVNSRAAALESSSSQSHSRVERHDRGPPPVLNKRFEHLADDERDRNRPRDRDRDSHRGQPQDSHRGQPQPANSRFAAAAAMADQERQERPQFRDDRGPPPVAKSRFAAAAAIAEEEARDREVRRQERTAHYGRDEDHGRGDRGPGDDRGPMQHGSRFSSEMANDRDYVDRDRRGDRGRFDDSRAPGDAFGSRGRDEVNRPTEASRVDDILKPKGPLPTDNILKPPTKPSPEQEASMFNFAAKPLSKEHEDNMLTLPKKEVLETSFEKAKPARPKEPVEEEKHVLPKESSEDLIAEFVSGSRLGDELKQWVDEHRVGFTAVDKLVYKLLVDKEKLNPDPECGWAEASKYGAALRILVEDDVYAQTMALFGIQLYCDKLGFPKLNDESVVQSMFRAMYKHDLAESDAFAAWKEDESDEHGQGKLTAVVQTVEWFNWLEEDEEEEDYDEDYEE